MFHGHLDCFPKPPRGGRPDTKLGDHWHSECSQPLIYNVLNHLWERAQIEIHRNSIWFERMITYGVTLHWEGPWPSHMIWEECWDGLWTFFFWALTKFHGHGSWLVCEVALICQCHVHIFESWIPNKLMCGTPLSCKQACGVTIIYT